MGNFGMHKIGFLIALYAVVLTACNTLSLEEFAIREQSKIPDDIDVLTEAEIREKIIGNTIEAMAPGFPATYVEYFHPNGTIRILWQETKYTGRWVVSGPLWCAEYKGDPKACYMFSINGDKVTWYLPDGTVNERETRLLLGNARNL